MSDRRYRVTRGYAARLNGHTDVQWPAGSEVELRDEDAAWVGRDVPGTLEEARPKPKPAPKAAKRREEAPK